MAEARFRSTGIPFWLGRALTEHGEWLDRQERQEEARVLLNEALGIFERLGALPWLERLGSQRPSTDQVLTTGTLHAPGREPTGIFADGNL
jgi:hypothetical protein